MVWKEYQAGQLQYRTMMSMTLVFCTQQLPFVLGSKPVLSPSCHRGSLRELRQKLVTPPWQPWQLIPANAAWMGDTMAPQWAQTSNSELTDAMWLQQEQT